MAHRYQVVIDSIHMLLLLLPGVTSTYYGDEISMPDNRQYHQYRSPMQWDGSTYAGFTEGETPWMPVNLDYVHINVAEQSSGGPSHLQVLRDLVKLKHSNVIRDGDFNVTRADDNVYSFTRIHQDENVAILVVLNFSPRLLHLDFEDSLKHSLPQHGVVLIRSEHSKGENAKPGSKIDLWNLQLEPYVGLVIQCSLS